MAERSAKQGRTDARSRNGRTQQERTEETKAALLVAASDMLKKHGYAQVSVAQIVKAAGRAHGTFYLYYDNKEEIYEALLDNIWEDLHAQSRAVWNKDEPLVSVHETVRRYVLSFRDNAELWQLLTDMSTTNPKFRTIRDERRRAFVRRIERGIRTSKVDQELPPLNNQIVAELLASMVDEICATVFIRGQRIDVEELVEHITVVWARVVGYDVPESFEEPAAG